MRKVDGFGIGGVGRFLIGAWLNVGLVGRGGVKLGVYREGGGKFSGLRRMGVLSFLYGFSLNSRMYRCVKL